MKKLSLILVVIMSLIIALALPTMAETKVNGNQVTFTFKAPNASLVYLSGNFNGWSPTGDKMTKGADGIWSVTIKLKPATYQYKFVVDGVWTADESAASLADDGFGGKNSILIVKPAGVADNARIDALETKIATLEQAQGGFSFTGYARTGFIVDEDGKKVNDQFGTPGAWAKYRLGNETGTFIENTLSKKWSINDGSWARATFMWAHSDDSKNNVWEDGAALRQSYVELGNLSDLNNLTFWAGRRYYRRDDIHLNDWFWKDFSGIGAGVQGINIGDTNLDIAYMYHGDNYVTQQLIFSLTGIKLGSGNLEIDFAPTFQLDDSVGDNGTGIALASKYSLGSFFGFTEGSSMLGLYYGDKLASNPNWFGPQNVISDVDENTHLRVLASGVSQITENFEIQPIILYQKTENATNEETWASIGCRPIYHFNKNFALQFEVGYDKTENNDVEFDGTKLTIAPTITLDLGYYTRPQARIFVNRYMPNNGDEYTTFGAQMEVWF